MKVKAISCGEWDCWTSPEWLERGLVAVWGPCCGFRLLRVECDDLSEMAYWEDY